DIRDKVVNHIMGIVPVVARLIRNPETGQRGFLLSENNGNFAKNQLDNREFALQEDLFKIGDVDAEA
ncbi:DNA-binding protein, partial [Listeria monocytogenes]